MNILNRKKKNLKMKLFFLMIFSFFIFFIFKKNIFSYTEHFTFFDNIKNNILSKENLLTENKELKLEIDFLKKSNDLVSFYKKQNDDLKNKLNYKNLFKTERIVVPTFFDNKINPYNSILIKDEKKQFNEGQLVFYKHNMLVGKISQKIGSIKKITPFSSFGFKNTFYIMDSFNLKMKIEGQGVGSGIIKIVAPRDIEFKNKNEVYLSYINNADFLIAKLVDVEFKKQDTNKILYFKIFPNLNLLSFVQIDKNN